MSFPLELPTGNPETQHEWHDTFRDMAKNMYRTSYSDMVHGREVAVRNDMPAGYGGHVPSLRHDVLFRNTGFDRRRAVMKENIMRDTFPSFAEQNEGIPAVTKLPRGRRKPPVAGTVPDVAVKPPWALTMSLQEPPSFRTMPSGSMTERSTRQSTGPTLQRRTNANALSTGRGLAAWPEFDRRDESRSPWPEMGVASSPQPPKSAESRLRFAVDSANDQSLGMNMPTEEDILFQQLQQHQRPWTVGNAVKGHL